MKEYKKILSSIITLMIGSLGIVSALAWNAAIQNTFNKIYPQQEGIKLTPRYAYAIIVTILAVLITVFLSKMNSKISI